MAQDSSEVCHKPLEVKVGFSGVRKHTSFRCDSFLWKEFVKVCKNEGLSTCDCLEKLILGWLTGFKYGVAHSATIHVSVDAPRIVKRVRRRKLVFEGENCEIDFERCHFCGKASVGKFRYKPTGKVYGLCGFHAGEFVSSRGSWECVKD
jgi:hypothetical protein